MKEDFLKEKKMPIGKLTKKGQLTIPAEVRKALNLKSSQKMIIILDGEQILIKPIKGNIIDIGGSIQIPDNEKPIDFHKVRHEVEKIVGEKIKGTK